MRDNYRAWAIDKNDFYKLGTMAERLKFLINFAVLAPSSHNSQPWKFAISDSQITLSPDFSRELPSSDANHRQLYTSLGCALENLTVAAGHYGFGFITQYFPNGTDQIVMTFVPGTKSIGENDLLPYVLKRHTNRNRYDSRLPDRIFLDWLRDGSSESLKIDVIKDPETKAKIAEVVTRANVCATQDKIFRSELSQYVKSNTTSAKLGMPMFGFGMPTLVSFIAPWVVKSFNVNKLSQKEDGRLLKEFTPVLVVISGAKDNKESWVRAGELYETIALMAEKEGIKTAPMAAVIQIGEFYKELQNCSKIEWRPLVFFRLGYSDKITKHSPRLSSGEVIKND
ncbi:MAG: nitroreductase family protein [Candidatus Vogelbacteria bacterium]|nr:nitroreductase family protein [Candidatus Vogelbacteria bacterium]